MIYRYSALVERKWVNSNVFITICKTLLINSPKQLKTRIHDALSAYKLINVPIEQCYITTPLLFDSYPKIIRLYHTTPLYMDILIGQLDRVSSDKFNTEFEYH